MNMRLVLALALALLPGCFEDNPDPEPAASTGAADSTTGTSDGATDGADSTTGEASVCPEYCSLMRDLCTGDLAQYTSDPICLAVCEALPPGNPDDQLGNSAACRRFQAVQASENADTFCGAAGPTGNGVCGAQCESFCGLAMELCTDDLAQWPDVPSCIADCMQFPDDVVYSANVTTGDSYACRAYHLTVAALDPGVHCPHVALVSATCG
jgi:hypothetical protein